MVGVAQLVERWLVVPEVAGSSPVVHPMVEVSGASAAVTNRGVEDTGTLEETDLRVDLQLGQPWITIVWNDPVNLQQYVTWVFETYFGFSPAKARRLMLQVHENGRAVVATGAREEMERHVQAMHGYGLQSSLEPAGS
ncbi:MAG: Clp protease ClpS [Glaciihabitans sp.]|jgi:ATP-dependent Clp protease adaptor protein ClpS|nr:Clp protease ClpS [Glaciihabitans sp.]